VTAVARERKRTRSRHDVFGTVAREANPCSGTKEQHHRDGEQRQRPLSRARVRGPRAGRGQLPRFQIVLQILEVVPQILGALVAVFDVLHEAPPHDLRQVARQRVIEVGDGARCVAQDARDCRDRRVALDGPLAGGQLVEDDAEREDVRALVDRFALGLLGDM
jgi:hypothetical protein